MFEPWTLVSKASEEWTKETGVKWTSSFLKPLKYWQWLNILSEKICALFEMFCGRLKIFIIKSGPATHFMSIWHVVWSLRLETKTTLSSTLQTLNKNIFHIFLVFRFAAISSQILVLRMFLFNYIYFLNERGCFKEKQNILSWRSSFLKRKNSACLIFKSL